MVYGLLFSVASMLSLLAYIKQEHKHPELVLELPISLGNIKRVYFLIYVVFMVILFLSTLCNTFFN